MDKKMAWQVDADGLIIAVIELSKQTGDYGKDGWLIPAGCVEKEPPKDKDGYIQRWNGNKWEYAKIEFAEEDEIPAVPEQDPRNRLNSEFAAEKAELTAAFVTAQMRNDVITQNEIREELKELEADYIAKSKLIDAGKNPWETEVTA